MHKIEIDKNMLAVAMAYAQACGERHPLKVFPLQSHGKLPLISSRDGGHGCLDATIDRATIEKWFKRTPNANVGIATGRNNGIIVIDVDIKHDLGKYGDESLRELEQELGKLPDTWECITPSGGRHLYFKYPEGYDIRNSESKLGEFIDVRGNGGYVVAPPSVLSNGRRYEWEASSIPKDTPLATLPGAWLNRLTQANATRVFQDAFALPDKVNEGCRNSTMFKYACSLRAKGILPTEIRKRMEAESKARFCPPLNDSEIELIFNSVLRYPDAGIVKNLSDEQIRKAIEDCKADSQNVMELLKTEVRYDKQGNAITRVICSAENFLTILRNDPYFSEVRYNEMRGCPERVANGKRSQWTDADDAILRNYIEKVYSISAKSKSDDAFLEFLQERKYHPVQDEIKQIQWDGKPRCEEMLIKWMHCDDTPYNRECSRLIFAGGINRAFRPGCKFDCVIVLIGEQGGGKSSFIQWLALNPSFYNSAKTITGQKGSEVVEGKWIVELEELLAVIANDKYNQPIAEASKQFLTRESENYRKPYCKNATDNPRHCIFVGTTNQTEFLTDKTGNRRWFPVKCGASKETARQMYECKKEVIEDIRQAWAEMYHAFVTDDPFSAPVEKFELLEAIESEQRSAETEDYREGVIATYIKGKPQVCCLQIWKEALHPDNNNLDNYTQAQRRDIGAILRKLNWADVGTRDFGKPIGRQKAFKPIQASESVADVFDELPQNDDNPLPFN